MKFIRGKSRPNAGKLRIVAGLLAGMSIAALCRPSVATPQVSQPDILMLVYAGADGHDMVGLTYPKAIPHAQAKTDLQALAAATGWAPTHVNIEDARAPLVGSKQMMTSVDFVAHGVIPSTGRYLPVEPVVSALRNYPHVAITYMVGGNYDFQGLRDYKDKYVTIALDERGNAYTYHIFVHDSKFPKLNLPIYQAPPSQTKVAAAPPPHRGVRPWQVLLVTLIACAAGGAVYFVMSRNAPA